MLIFLRARREEISTLHYMTALPQRGFGPDFYLCNIPHCKYRQKDDDRGWRGKAGELKRKQDKIFITCSAYLKRQTEKKKTWTWLYSNYHRYKNVEGREHINTTYTKSTLN